MSDSRILLRNSVFSLLAALMGRVSASIAFILVARILGPSEAGQYALGVAFAMVGTSVANWGLDQVLARDVASDRAQAGQYVANFLVVRGVLATLLVLGITMMTRWPLAYEPHVANTIVIMTLSILPDALDDVWQSLFTAFERVSIPAVTSTITGIGRLLAAYVVLMLGGTVEIVALVVVVTSLVRLGINMGLGLHYLGGPLGPLSVSFCSTQLRKALPFLFVNICITLGAQADTILLSLFLTEYDVGLYRGALTLVTAAVLIPQAYRVAALPTLSRLYRGALGAFERMYHRSSFYLLVLVLPISMGLILMAEPILSWLYGEEFASAAGALRVLALGLPFSFLVVPNARVLVVTHRQDTAAKVQGVSTFTGLLLMLSLMPLAQMVGAAIGRVAADAVFFVGCYQYVYRHVIRFQIHRTAWRPFLAATFMALILFFVGPKASPLISMSAGAITYVAALLLLRALPEEDRERLRRLLHMARQ